MKKQIEKDYIKLAKKHCSKGFIISSLQMKYRNGNGLPYSNVTIYNYLDLKSIRKKLSGSAGEQPWM
ncbi:MAG: hypothetical protein LBG80_19195 [Bacteroidales bacterium]|nr:hypothetical protein [Bacteroidales bacterium]